MPQILDIREGWACQKSYRVGRAGQYPPLVGRDDIDGTLLWCLILVMSSGCYWFQADNPHTKRIPSEIPLNREVLSPLRRWGSLSCRPRWVFRKQVIQAKEWEQIWRRPICMYVRWQWQWGIRTEQWHQQRHWSKPDDRLILPDYTTQGSILNKSRWGMQQPFRIVQAMLIIFIASIITISMIIVVFM